MHIKQRRLHFLLLVFAIIFTVFMITACAVEYEVILEANPVEWEDKMGFVD